LLRLYKDSFSNHHGFAQLALGAFSFYDTAPSTVFKGLPTDKSRGDHRFGTFRPMRTFFAFWRPWDHVVN
jgi:hypothetical protein